MSASARTGRCKKIAVSQRVFSNFPVPYVSRYCQFSCGFRRASEGVPPSDTAPLNSFLPPGASPPGNPSGEAGGRINSPTNPNLKLLSFCDHFSPKKKTESPHFPFSVLFSFSVLDFAFYILHFAFTSTVTTSQGLKKRGTQGTVLATPREMIKRFSWSPEVYFGNSPWSGA